MNDLRVEYTFLWFIENYSYCWYEVGQKLLSPYFIADELENTTWSIGVFPRGQRGVDKGYISLFLYGPFGENISLDCELSFLGADGSPHCSKVGNCTFTTESKETGHGWKKFALMQVVPQDILTVRCRIWKGEGNVRKVAPISARTRIAIENISFLHVVENFSTLEPNQKMTVEIRSHSKEGCVVSSSQYFTNESLCEGEMIVEITPSDSNRILCKRKISLIGSSGNIIACGENDNRWDVERKDIQKLPLSLTRQVILNKKSEYLPDDKLSFLCECIFFTGLEFEKIEETQHETSSPAVIQASNQVLNEKNDNTVEKASKYPSALEDIKALYVNQRLTDVELKTETKSFPAHRIVLCARSPVFEAMLTHDMKEKNTGYIQVDDLGDDIVQQMLLFLYSDNVENLQWNTATQLYNAADKYQIGKLKEVCSSFLVENLTATNSGELLDQADTHSDSDLKKSVVDFILEHEKEVFGSKEWEKLMETNPLLALKTMHLKYKRENEVN